MMMDLSRLNKLVIPVHYPLPTLPEVFQKVQGSASLSMLDLMKAYHYIEVHPESHLLTLTMTPLGPQQYVKMPLGLKDSSAVFQWCIWETLEDCPGSIPYIDDVLVYGKSQQEHDHNLEWVLQALHSKNFCLQLPKCLFQQASLPFLGHILSGKELKPSPSTAAAITDAPTPRTAQQLSSFLGLVTFYIDFIPDLATKVELLWALGCKGVMFSWTEECQKAYDGIT